MARSMYEKRELTLSSLLESATHNASICVPDLQRPYVWSPSQVSLLVDSIFRGWPFGTLLTWTVKPEVIQGCTEGIPARGFYTLVSRADPSIEKTAVRHVGGFNTEDTMVLDGQQRLQSMILAFGDSDGICLYDCDWEKLQNPSARPRFKPYYTTASLCLDLGLYLAEMSSCRHLCRNVDLNRCLRWVVTQPTLCSVSHKHGRLPLPCLNSSADGAFVPLRAIWANTDARQNEDEDIEPTARSFVKGAFPDDDTCSTFCEKFGGMESVVRDVVKFLRRCCEIKELLVTCLNVVAYVEPPNGNAEEKKLSRQEYDDAIVNIFTRLNTAGRALTREEITFAWVKSTWKEAGIGSDRYPKAEVFIKAIRDVFSEWNLPDDEYIRALSIIWCNHDVGRNGKPLETRELLQAGIIRNMSRFLRTNADALIMAARMVNDIYLESRLSGVVDSFNDITIAWDFCYEGEKERQRVMHGRSEHDKDNSRKSLLAACRFFIARWAVLPSWGKNWANQSALFLSRTMSIVATHLRSLSTASDEMAWRDGMATMSIALNGNAEADARQLLKMPLWERKVYLYRSRLSVWQCLNESRAKYRHLTFQDANSQVDAQLNVDHIVAYAAWQERINDAFANGTLNVQHAALCLCEYTEDDIARELARNPEEFESRVKVESVEFINNIGNCMILNAGYNIAKRKRQLAEFMDQMYEFKEDTPASLRVDRNEWSVAMKLDDVLLRPNEHTIEEIATAIRSRETEIYDELTQFVSCHEPVLY